MRLGRPLGAAELAAEMRLYADQNDAGTQAWRRQINENLRVTAALIDSPDETDPMASIATLTRENRGLLDDVAALKTSRVNHMNRLHELERREHELRSMLLDACQGLIGNLSRKA